MQNPADAVKPGIRAMGGYTLVQPVCLVKLNQNECPFDVPETIKREIVDRAMTRNWGRYPDFVPMEVKTRLGAHHGLGPESILVGNGSNELIQALFMATVSAGDRVVLSVPTFTLYSLMNTALEGQLRAVHLRRDMTFDVDRLIEEGAQPGTKLVVLCAPNNPTGSVLDTQNVARIAAAAAGWVVMDEAYVEFGETSHVSLLAEHPNLIVTRTFSKALGAAGLRIGYLVAHPDIAHEIDKVKLPYNVNLISLIATERLLDEPEMLAERVAFIRSERARVFARLQTLPGIRPYPSEANFILFETDRPVKTVFNALIDRDVLIRDVSRYPMLERAMRATIGTAAENDAFLDALEDTLKHLP
ncbi:MAG: histidinol-phosphate transaminase [candidate division Zixibacteria bacterium]|nr:histidinol-phosphate transaminase [candidate division Zixibacteria bacterium]